MLTRPLVKRFVKKKNVPTNADRIVGAEGVVIKTIETIENSGQIKVMGQVWSAMSESGEKIGEGESVIVCGLDGVRAVVEKK